MAQVYSELVDFIAAGTTPRAVAEFTVSESTKRLVADLLRREKIGDLTPEERIDLERFMNLEHVMRLAKAKARLNAGR